MGLVKIIMNEHCVCILFKIFLCLFFVGCTSIPLQESSPFSIPSSPSYQYQLNIEDIPHAPSEQIIDLN